MNFKKGLATYPFVFMDCQCTYVQNESCYIEFIDPELLELVKLYQVHAHLILNVHEKRDILTWRNTGIRQFESYINNNLNPAKRRCSNKRPFCSGTEYQRNFRWFGKSTDDYYRALSISKDKDFRVAVEERTLLLHF